MTGYMISQYHAFLQFILYVLPLVYGLDVHEGGLPADADQQRLA